MTIVRNQHYVPRLYLERFTHNGNGLFVFDKKNCRSYPASIKDVASEKFFYDFPPEVTRDLTKRQVVEKAFGLVEGELANVLRQLLDDIETKGSLNLACKPLVSLHLSVLLLRTREFRTQMAATSEEMDRQLAEKGVPVRLSEGAIPALEHARMIFNEELVREMLGHLSRHIWVVGDNTTDQPLFASDAPIVRKAHFKEELLSHTGIASPGIEIAFPLSPRYILILFEKTFFKTEEYLDCRKVDLVPDNVLYYNGLQVCQCYQRVFCPADKFDDARRIAKEHPATCVPDRPRVGSPPGVAHTAKR